MTTQNNKNSQKRPIQTVSAIIRWGIGGFLAMCALGNGFHYSSLFLVFAAFLMFPLPFVEAFFKKIKLKTVFIILLSFICFIVGFISSPMSNPSYDYDDTIINNEQPNDSSENGSGYSTENSDIDNTSQYSNSMSDNDELPESDIITSDNNEPIEPDITSSDNNEQIDPDVTTSSNNEPIEPDITTSDDKDLNEPDATTSINASTIAPSTTDSKETQAKMVWIPSGGSKYHSKSSCSNMKSPRQVTLEYAKRNGYEPCKKCY